MVTRHQIKDWLDVDKKALNVAGRPVETDFYNLWCSSEISRDNFLYVRTEIVKKYRQLGLIVKDRTFDEGWDSSFDGLQITIPSDF